jgi:hypothetical protein
MIKTGASQTELAELMKAALDEAANNLPFYMQTSTMKVVASRILSAAANGVRDPIQLRTAALMEIDDVEDQNDIYRCYAQLQRLRLKVEHAEAARAEIRPERVAGLHVRQRAGRISQRYR